MSEVSDLAAASTSSSDVSAVSALPTASPVSTSSNVSSSPSETTDPLVSRESFQTYAEGIKKQLHSFVVERIQFLQGAAVELRALYALAHKSGNPALKEELSGHFYRASAELKALRGIGSETANGAVSSALSPSERTGASTSANGVPIPARAGDPRIDASRSASMSTPTAPPKPTLPPVPKTPARPLEELYSETEILTEQAEQEGDVFAGKTGLIRLKALLCRQRGIQAEFAAQDIQHWPLRSLFNYIRRRIDDEHGPGHYLISLRSDLWQAEAWPWYRLADLYDLLADAHIALDWYDKECEKLTNTERMELLESIASHQTRLWRHLQTFFPRQNDEHQIQFFRELCAIAEEEDYYLFSLQERCPDETLDERAEQMPVILEHLQLDKKNRAKREAALQKLRTLVINPDFGTRDTDPIELNSAVAECRKQGAPASSTALRSMLMPWLSLLEESTEKSVQEVARELQKESERLAKKAQAQMEAQEAEASLSALSESEQAELDAVRNLLRGKRCLFIGGICREESRQRLEKELELAELVWPSTNGAESVYKFESDIEKTDITVIMVRFMRTGWGQARELAVKHNKMFVRLPAGYGLMQVARQITRQLLHEEAAVAAK
jgi:hypothetical protein